MSAKGISKSIECPNTGAVATFHRIDYYSVDLRSKYSTLVINGYISEAAYSNGKIGVTSSNVTLQGAPASTDDVLDFFYKNVTAPAPAVTDSTQLIAQANVFAGAQLVQDVVAPVNSTVVPTADAEPAVSATTDATPMAV